jgi:REP element-mobilizing transposase RayT
MAHTYTNLVVHALFSTKERKRSITPELKADLHAYMGGILRNLKVRTLALNGIEDHVHLLVVLPPTLCTADLMEALKSSSTGWVRKKGGESKTFAWQGGYTAFSVSQSNIGVVKAYIENQEQHHRKMSFKEELAAFLEKHGISYDERYLLG